MKQVSIITRTKNRPLFLARALKSVADQTFSDFQWIIVNDGGETEGVESIKRAAISFGLEVTVIHVNESRGMEAASNIGLRQSDSPFIAMHDDDDTWHPDFLLEAIQFISSERGKIYGGVVTQTLKILERIVGDAVIEMSRQIYNPGLSVVYLAEMARGNIFTNNSFVFKRSLLSEVGYFDETLPVRGDWDFNLRFLQHADIGVIQKPLTNWHHRTEGIGANANSVIGVNKNIHLEFDAIIRNRYLREDMVKGKFGLGMLLNMQSKGTVFQKKPKRSLVGFIRKILTGR